MSRHSPPAVRSTLSMLTLSAAVVAAFAGLALTQQSTTAASATPAVPTTEAAVQSVASEPAPAPTPSRVQAARVLPVLQLGDRGQDVMDLEQRMAELKLDVGKVDGVYDDDTAHAVTAMQKVTGLPRTGVVDIPTEERLARPLDVHLLHPTSGRALEVDLTTQVLYLTQAGKVQRIVDTSTGSNQIIDVSGVQERAYTPTGAFTIERKINGVRNAPLGRLYRPAYFTQGWAVHGDPDVPPEPASHGCVRVTDAAQDRLYDLLTIGTPIFLYGG